jgi:hypothetical protein
MFVVPLRHEYDAFRDQALFALRASRESSKLYWAVGPPTMKALADRRLPDTFNEMLRAHSKDPGPICVYVFEQTAAKSSPTSTPEQADLDRLTNLSSPPRKKLEFKGASRSGKSTSSASTSSPASSYRSTIFRECVLEYDKKCVLCGDEAAPEAAHIIPVRAVGNPKLAPCLLDAELEQTSINNLVNGMRLCATHHSAFDKFQWAVNPTDMKVVTATGAPDSICRFTGATLDFSDRTLSFTIPPKRIWAAYYKHLFEPRTQSELMGGAGAASGGAGSAAPRGSREARSGATRGGAGRETPTDGTAVASERPKHGSGVGKRTATGKGGKR